MLNRRTLRIIFPQWQGGKSPTRHLGAQLLEFLAPDFNGETLHIPVTAPEDAGVEDTLTVQGIRGHGAIVKHLRLAKKEISTRNPDRIVILGGDCGAMVAPFHHLSQRYGEKLGLLWIDAHPDLWDATNNSNFNAMTVSALLAECAPDINREITHPVRFENIHWVGLRSDLSDAIRRLPQALAQSTSASEANISSTSVLEWVQKTGISKLAIHLDLDSLDPAQFSLLAVPEPDGLRFEAIARLCQDLSEAVDIVGFGVAEHAPEELSQLRKLLTGLPLFQG